jgi:hypothetical protein
MLRSFNKAEGFTAVVTYTVKFALFALHIVEASSHCPPKGPRIVPRLDSSRSGI